MEKGSEPNRRCPRNGIPTMMHPIEESLIQALWPQERVTLRWYHHGSLAQKDIESGCHFIEGRIQEVKCRKALLTVFIELSQNVLLHRTPTSSSVLAHSKRSRVEIAQSSTHWFVATQNLAYNTACQRVAHQIQELQKLSNKELKERFKELRKQGNSTTGAGLGICRILRQSKHTIYLKKAPIFDSISLLTLVSKIQIS